MEKDPEKRRQQRERQARYRRMRARKQRKVLLIVVGVLLAAALILTVVLLLTAKKKDVPAVATDATGETAPPDPVAHLAFAGDLNVTENVLAAGEAGYAKALLDVAPVLADADITTLNFEGSPSTVPPSLLQSLRRAGVDLLQLANSYSISDGISGLSNSVDAVRNAGMEPLGVYKNEEEARAGKGYTIREVNGIRIAFVAFTKGMDGMTLPTGSTNCVNLLYKDYDSTYQNIDNTRIVNILAAVQREKPDLTVALLHWGSEYNDTVSKTQDKIRKLLYDNHVDVIVGTHAHFLQKMEHDPETGKFTAFCLGDFYGDAGRSGAEYSVILNLEIKKEAERTYVAGYAYTPVYTVKNEGKPVQAVRIREAMTAFEEGFISRVPQETYDAMAYALTRIEERINGK